MNEKLYTKGLRTPLPLAWLLGVIHGRWMKTAAVEADSGRLVSGYVEQKHRQLEANSAAAVVALERELRSSRAETLRLVSEAQDLHRQLETLPAEPKDDPRQAARIRQQRAAAEKRQQEIRSRLLVLRKYIQSRELCCQERLKAAATRLRRLLAAYAHGALRKPITAAHVPPVGGMDSFVLYRANHSEEDSWMDEATCGRKENTDAV